MCRIWYWQSAHSLERGDRKSCSSHYVAPSAMGKGFPGQTLAGQPHGIPKTLYFCSRIQCPQELHTQLSTIQGQNLVSPKPGCHKAVPRDTQGQLGQAGQGSTPPESRTAGAHCSGQQEREQTERQLHSPQRQQNICSGKRLEAETRSVRPE